MPINASRKLEPLERIAGETLPIVTAGTPEGKEEVRASLGDLLQIDASAIEGANGSARAITKFNKTVEESWMSGVLGAYTARMIRCIALQTEAQPFMDSSRHLTTRQTLRSAESESGPALTYQRLIEDDWRRLAAETGDPHVAEIVHDAITRLVATMIPAEEQGKTVGLLRTIGLQYGRKMFESVTGLNFQILARRTKTGQLGAFEDTFVPVEAMVRHLRPSDSSASAEEEPLVAFWDHPWMVEVRAAWLRDTESYLKGKRQPHDPMAMLAERLKMLAGMSSHKQHEGALREHFGIPSPTARVLAGNNMHEVGDEHVVKILDTLVERRIIPPGERSAFLENLHSLRAVTAAPDTLSRRLREALDAGGVTNEMVALCLNVKDRRPHEPSPVNLTRETIDCMHMNDAVPVYAVSCLARATLAEVHEDMRAFEGEYGRRIKNVGRRFSTQHLHMLQFGLTPDDLPEEFRDAEIPVDEVESGHRPSRTPLTTAILEAGWNRSAAAVEKWIALHEPETLEDVFTYFPEKVGGPALYAGLTRQRKHHEAYRKGRDVPPLPHVRRMVENAGALVHPVLVEDWYRKRSARNAKSMKPLQRALDLHMATTHETMTEFVTATFAENADRAPTDAARTALRLMRRKTVKSENEEALFRGLGLAGTDPRSLFFRSLREKKHMGKAVDRWCILLAERGHNHILSAVRRARQRLLRPAPEPPSPHKRLEFAMDMKEGVRQRMSGDAKENTESDLHIVLRHAPGLTEHDLLQWQPPEEATATPSAGRIAMPPAAKPAAEAIAVPEAGAVYADILGRIADTIDDRQRPYIEDIAAECKLRAAFDRLWKANMRDPAALAKRLGVAVRLHIATSARD